MQTSAVLTFLNYDFAQAFVQCARVEGEHQTTCYRSLGRDISGYTLRDAARVNELCRLGQGDQIQQCFIGAVKDFILTDANPDPGLACAAAWMGRLKKIAMPLSARWSSPCMTIKQTGTGLSIARARTGMSMPVWPTPQRSNYFSTRLNPRHTPPA